MALVTRCSNAACLTLFRVTPAQLQAFGGQVRCGTCGGVFDAFPSLATVADAALRVPVEPADSEVAATAAMTQSTSPAATSADPASQVPTSFDAAPIDRSGDLMAQRLRAADEQDTDPEDDEPGRVTDLSVTRYGIGATDLTDAMATGLAPAAEPARSAALPADAQPTDAQPTDTQPTDIKPNDGKPMDVQSMDVQPARDLSLSQPDAPEALPLAAAPLASPAPVAATVAPLSGQWPAPESERLPAAADQLPPDPVSAPQTLSGQRSSVESVSRPLDAPIPAEPIPAEPSAAPELTDYSLTRGPPLRTVAPKRLSRRWIASLFALLLAVAGTAIWLARDQLPQPLAAAVDGATRAFATAEPLVLLREHGVLLALVLSLLLLVVLGRYRATWLVALGVLFLLLGGQLLYAYRTQIAAHYPATRSTLEQLCALAGCEVGLPRAAEQLVIEASDLQALDVNRPNLILLSATVRNRASIALAYPAIEVTLTDPQDRPLARRVLLPDQYLARRPDNRTGLRAGEDFSIKLTLDTTELRPVGYRLYLFYP